MPPRNRDPPEDPDQDGRVMLTAKEGEVFFFFVKNIRNKPDIDWEGFAIDCGWKNADTAKVRMGQIKRKLGLGNWGENLGSADGSAGPSGSAAAPAVTPAPKAPRAPRSTPKSRKTAQLAALGPSPGGGVSKSQANRSSSARSKVEKDALLAAAKTANDSPKDDEDPEASEAADAHPTLEANQDIDDAPMDLAEDEKLGKFTQTPITQSPAPISPKAAPKRETPLKTESTKTIPALARSQATAGDVPLHPKYISEYLSPIPGTAGSFQTAQVPPPRQVAQAQIPPPRRNNKDPSPPSTSIQSPPIKDWESDEDSKAINKLRNGAAGSNKSSNMPPPVRIPSYIDPANYPVPPRPAPLNRHNISAHNLNNSGRNFNLVDSVPELSLSSMMSGGLPGGSSAGPYSNTNTHPFSHTQPPPTTYRAALNLQAAYTPSTQPQVRQHYDLTEEDEEEAEAPARLDPTYFAGNSLFGAGGSGGGGSGRDRGGSGRK